MKSNAPLGHLRAGRIVGWCSDLPEQDDPVIVEG
jgi:hypothetical protein